MVSKKRQPFIKKTEWICTRPNHLNRPDKLWQRSKKAYQGIQVRHMSINHLTWISSWRTLDYFENY